MFPPSSGPEPCVCNFASSWLLLIFRAISGPLAHRGERARLAVVIVAVPLTVALLGLDVRVDRVRDRPVCTTRLMLVDQSRALLS